MSTPVFPWPEYNPQAIEPKWQQLWEREALYLTSPVSDRPKFYCLDFFPYPSGDGLHVGHCRNYVPTDVLSRFKRMQGFHVLHPMGWDAFGEPTERHAMQHNIHPRETTDRNTANFRRQMRLIGASYDWSREIDSSRPEYYRWTQAFFLLLYRRGLAYRDTNWQWWCPECQTTLSSHEVAGGVCWRGHSGVHRRKIPAWYFRITAYADELAEALDSVDWPEPIKAMQRNWIGRSEGCQVTFGTPDGVALPVFTTRPDTLFGVSFLVLAPEHPLVDLLTVEAQRDLVRAYVVQAARRGEVERMQADREKTGIFTGSYATHPLSGAKIPIWVADYVLPGYGTGAVMGVPAHDERDFAFARRFDLDIPVVIAPPGAASLDSAAWQQAYPGEGQLVNSGQFDGLASQEAGQQITAALQQAGAGQPQVTYRMRDWLISRQRYWGAPIPIVLCPECGPTPVPESELPVLLPEMQDFRPDDSGRSPLARLPEFVNTTCPQCGAPAQRETDTMGGFACSSWYFLRFASPHDDRQAFDPQAVRYWLPVDLYVGGAEHAVLHLLYARFWTKVMADAGLLAFREPFSKLLNQGQLLGLDGQRMSKSRGNVITPDSIAESFGADALRLYVMFMAPFDQDIGWAEDGVRGTRRFLNRIWTLYGETYGACQAAQGEDALLTRRMHQTIQRVGERIQAFRFNTMVSALMEFANLLFERRQAGAWQTAAYSHALETMMVLLAPAAPHFAEELWRVTGHTDSVHRQPWPAWDPDLAAEETVQVAVQINGRLRGVVDAPLQASQDEIVALVCSQGSLQAYLAGKSITRAFYVPGKIINLMLDNAV